MIRELSEVSDGELYFPNHVKDIIREKFKPLKKEYYDVPLDLEPIGLIGLLGNFPVTTEFKQDLLDVLKDVKVSLEPHKNYEPEIIAAHHDGEEWTVEELEEIERFKEFVRSKRKGR